MPLNNDVWQKNTNGRRKKQKDFSQTINAGEDETRETASVRGELRVHGNVEHEGVLTERKRKGPLLFPRGGGCCQEHQVLSATHSLAYKHISPLKNLFHFSKLEPPAWKDNGACPINSSSSSGLWQVLNCAISLDPHFKRSAFRWWKCFYVQCSMEILSESVFIIYSQ